MIRNATASDAKAITDIYNYYLKNTVITFEEEILTNDVLQKRIESVQQLGLPWIVLEQQSSVVGYAYASKWKERSAYRFTVEISVYLHHQAQGKGVGSLLYSALISQLKEIGVQSVIGGITLPNPPSVALHEKMGMKKVAHFEKVGFKFNQWLDVGYWQLNLK